MTPLHAILHLRIYFQGICPLTIGTSSGPRKADSKMKFWLWITCQLAGNEDTIICD